MVWHDCKTDPPKKSGCYILCFVSPWNMKHWKKCWYNVNLKSWDCFDEFAYKWAEVDLSEVE